MFLQSRVFWYSAVQTGYSALLLPSDLEKSQISSFQEKQSGIGISSAWNGCETPAKALPDRAMGLDMGELLGVGH